MRHIIDNSYPLPLLQSAHAILLLEGKYVLQLRDIKSGIAAPGQWSLFGGLISIKETPDDCIRREIFEELCILLNNFNYLWYSDYMAEFEGSLIRSWFFSADVSEVWENHKLMEGKGVGIFKFEEIIKMKMPYIMKETIEKYEKQIRNSVSH